MTSAGTESTTISLPDATTGIGLLVGRAEGGADCAPSTVPGFRQPRKNLPAGSRVRLEARGAGPPPRPSRWTRRPHGLPELPSCLGPAAETTWAGKGGGPRGVPRGWGEVKASTRIGRQRASNPIRQNGPRVGGNKEANAGAGCAGARALSADWLSERERPGARADGSPASGAPGM